MEGTGTLLVAAVGKNSVYGKLKMKGVTKSVNFPVMVNTSEGTVNVKSSKFKTNRTDWGIKFMSSSFFDDLKDKFIDDDIELQLNLVAKA